MDAKAEEFRQQKKHNSLLLVAAARGYLDDVKALLERGATLDARDKGGLGPVHFAAGRGRLEVVELLWSKGADLDADSPDGKTPLHLAAAAGHAAVVSLLLKKGAWAEAEDSADDTPLHAAAQHGHVAALDALMQHGVKADRPNKLRLTAAGEALLRGHVEAVELLAGWGAGVAERPRGYSLLHLAAGLGRSEAVEWLLTRSPADVSDCANPERRTPLHSAALGGDERCVELLLAAAADPAAADAGGMVPEDLLPGGGLQGRAANALALLKAAAPARLHQQPAAPSAGAAAAAAAETSPPRPRSARRAFAVLPPSERVSKAGRWVALGSADLDAALKEYPRDVAAEVTARLAQARAVRCRINVHKAMAALRADEDFQGAAAAAEVAAAVEAVRKDPGQYERYIRDGRVAGVMAKMRRVHAVAQANGQRTVAMEDMVVGRGGAKKRQAEDAAALQRLEQEYAAYVAAAAAAAAADPDAAAAAAEAAFQAALKKAGGAAGGAMSAAAASSSALKAAAPLAQRAVPRGPERQSEIEEHPEAVEGGDPNVPEWMKGDFSWGKVWQEFLSQAKTSLVLLALFFLASILIRGRLPWQPASSAGQGPGGHEEL